jgi:hypothetical protein
MVLMLILQYWYDDGNGDDDCEGPSDGGGDC